MKTLSLVWLVPLKSEQEAESRFRQIELILVMEESHKGALKNYQCVTSTVHSYISEEKPCAFCSCSHLGKCSIFQTDMSLLQGHATSSCPQKMLSRVQYCANFIHNISGLLKVWVSRSPFKEQQMETHVLILIKNIMILFGAVKV